LGANCAPWVGISSAVCASTCRDTRPGGRAQRTYGEDPIHLGKFGAALVRGVQKHVMACAKHYALNSMAPLGLRQITGFQVLQHARRAAARLNPAAPGVLLDESGWGLVPAEQRFEVDFISQIRR
jgi:hypothetical protein